MNKKAIQTDPDSYEKLMNTYEIIEVPEIIYIWIKVIGKELCNHTIKVWAEE